MQKRGLGTTLTATGFIGLALMGAALIVALWQATQLRGRADEILVPIAAGLDDFEQQLDTVERLVDDFVTVLPAETIVELATQGRELSLRLETIDAYIESAQRALLALDAIPFLPIDLDDLARDLEELDEGLETIRTRLDDVATFVLENQEVPAQIVDGANSGIDQLRTGLEAAQEEVASVSNAVDRSLYGGVIFAVILLLLGIAGQIALIAWGRRLRDQSPAGAPTS